MSADIKTWEQRMPFPPGSEASRVGYMLAEIADLRAALAAKTEGAARDIVPGKMHCARCHFTLLRNKLYVNSGTIGSGGNETEPCPNGCGPLWPMTWEQEARDGYKLMDDLFERAKKAEDAFKAEQALPGPLYVECRECDKCGHAGINDSHNTDASCDSCSWSGPSPLEDKCPECDEIGAMVAACPKCSGHYRLIADYELTAPSMAVEPVACVWQYKVNGAHTGYSELMPPDDAYDAGTLVALGRIVPANGAVTDYGIISAPAVQQGGEAAACNRNSVLEEAYRIVMDAPLTNRCGIRPYFTADCRAMAVHIGAAIRLLQSQPAAAPPLMDDNSGDLRDDEIEVIYKNAFESAHGCTRSAPRPLPLVFDFARDIIAATKGAAKP